MKDLFKNTKNRQSKVLLYQKYLLQEKEEHQNALPPSKPMKKKNKVIKFPKYIGIASVAHGSGASHLTYAIANYLATVQRKTVVVVSNCPEMYQCAGRFAVERVPHPAMIEQTDIYIQDYGCLEDMTKDQKDTYRVMEKKILCCNFSDYYLESLAAFVRAYVKDPEQWLFVFNQLTKKKQREVADLMEGYHFICPPAYDKNDIRIVTDLLMEVFGE